MTTTITLTFRWPMGHRILGLPGSGEKCRNIHGHNWTADVEFPVHNHTAGDLEFGAVKAAVNTWLDAVLDHGFAVAHDDPFRDYLVAEDLKHVTLAGPPTTEALAAYIAGTVENLVGRRPCRVHLVEGYRNAATWIADE